MKLGDFAFWAFIFSTIFVDLALLALSAILAFLSRNWVQTILGGVMVGVLVFWYRGWDVERLPFLALSVLAGVIATSLFFGFKRFMSGHV